MAFPTNELHGDRAPGRFVPLFEQFCVQIIGHHDIAIAMDDKHRHLVRSERGEVIDRIKFG